MRRKLCMLTILVAILALAAAGSLAEVQTKSWDVKHEEIYSIETYKYFAVIENADEVFGSFEIRSASGVLPNQMRGTWTVTKVEGGDVEVEVRSDGGPKGELALIKGVSGQDADFDLTYTSNDLVNPVSARIYVYVMPPEEIYPTDYVYPKTEHDAKTGVWFDIEGGEALPDGIGDYYYVVVKLLDPSSEWSGKSGIIFVEPDTGVISGYIYEPGDYKVTVRAYLMDNLHKDITHTFTVTGAPIDYPISDFYLNFDEANLNTLEVKDAGKRVDLYHLYLEDPIGRMDDEFTFELVQTQGAALDVKYEKKKPWDYEIYIDNGLPTGEYKFVATLTDVTRGESDSCDINLTVTEQEDAVPDGIYYDNIKDVTTIKGGNTLKFKAPKFENKASKLPDDYYYYLAIDGIDEELFYKMVDEDADKGKHVIRGLEVGEYKVRAGLSMFSGTRVTEKEFKLVVEPAKGTMAQSINIVQQGDVDNPYEFVAGNKVKLKVEFTPKNTKNKKVTWESSYPGINVSDKGVVTAYEYPCSSVITATAVDGSGVKDSIVVYAKPPRPTKIALSKKKLTMEVGNYAVLNVKFTPKKLPKDCREVVWASDNSEVAEVSSYGEVYAMKPGTAVIYAYAIDRENFAGGILKDVFAQCVVTVK